MDEHLLAIEKQHYSFIWGEIEISLELIWERSYQILIRHFLTSTITSLKICDKDFNYISTSPSQQGVLDSRRQVMLTEIEAIMNGCDGWVSNFLKFELENWSSYWANSKSDTLVQDWWSSKYISPFGIDLSSSWLKYNNCSRMERPEKIELKMEGICRRKPRNCVLYKSWCWLENSRKRVCLCQAMLVQLLEMISFSPSMKLMKINLNRSITINLMEQIHRFWCISIR